MWIEMSMPYDPVCACYPMHGVSSTGYVHCRPVFGSKVISPRARQSPSSAMIYPFCNLVSFSTNGLSDKHLIYPAAKLEGSIICSHSGINQPSRCASDRPSNALGTISTALPLFADQLVLLSDLMITKILWSWATILASSLHHLSSRSFCCATDHVAPSIQTWHQSKSLQPNFSCIFWSHIHYILSSLNSQSFSECSHSTGQITLLKSCFQ